MTTKTPPPSGGSRPANAPQPGQTQTSGCLARIWWMAAGNVALVGTAAFIGQQKQPFPSPWDGLLVLVAASIVLVRWADVTLWGGTTGDGERATMAHVKQHAVRVAGFTVIAGLVAHLLSR